MGFGLALFACGLSLLFCHVCAASGTSAVCRGFCGSPRMHEALRGAQMLASSLSGWLAWLSPFRAHTEFVRRLPSTEGSSIDRTHPRLQDRPLRYRRLDGRC
ncbi:hypothetical protein C8Q80DRAFT_470281 [Daedaleopsis nitida]|nr:hypothetical protein C8Q80DRAFT_470281 [Daedaleopsis nitida]